MRPIATACALALLLCAAALAYANLKGSGEAFERPKKREALTLSGSVDNLQPGVPTVLTVNVRNNLRKRVKVRSLKLAVDDANEACPRTMLQTAPVRVRTALKPRRTRSIPVTVTLLSTAPDECQDASFPIRYSARAKVSKKKR